MGVLGHCPRQPVVECEEGSPELLCQHDVACVAGREVVEEREATRQERTVREGLDSSIESIEAQQYFIRGS